MLIVNNLSRFAQPVKLDLSRFIGSTPVELMGNTAFPPIEASPYFLSIGPHGFFWFKLVSTPVGEQVVA
jgi:maltose alpha-D-glucosyltransferase/alpha-amylase